MPPAPFSEVNHDTTDDEILSAVADDDPASVVADGIGWLQERFDPAATATTGVIQWEVEAGTHRVRWQLRVGDDGCEAVDLDGDDSAEPRRPDLILATSLPEFVRLVAGAADVMDRFGSGHVLIAGTLPLARALALWFPVR